MRKTFDYIIVGGGSAGCVLAERLSRCGQYQVALLEAGGDGRSMFVDMPGGVAFCMQSKRLNWRLRSADKAPLRNGEGLFTPRGKGLGGSSAINAMIYTRGAPSDYDGWAAVTDQSWSWAELLPRFKRLESNSRGASDFHGASGPLKVADNGPYFSVSKQFILAGQQAGLPHNTDFNDGELEGVGAYQFTISNGQRWSARKAFLEPAMKRTNLTVITHCLSQRVTFDGDKATGIVATHKGQQVRFESRREVILSAGTFHSPQLLQLSGIGDAEVLTDLNIEVVADRPQVGQNLQEHVDVLLHYRNAMRDGITLNVPGLLKMAGQWWQYARRKSGALAHSVAEVGGFLKSRPELKTPDLQLHLVPTLFDDSGFDLKPARRHGYACHVCVLRPKARGYVQIQSTDVKQQPKFVYDFLQHEEDQKALLSGVRQVRDIMSQPALTAHNGGELLPGIQCQSDTELLYSIRKHCGLIYHPVGTCRMGNDADSVVDAELKVRGVKGLRVIDASIMPTVISGNTNAPTMVIADKGADHILADAANR